MRIRKFVFFVLLTAVMLLPSFPTAADSGSLTVGRAVSPDLIYLAGSGYAPETSTVTLSVAGYGGTITQTLPIDVVFSIDSSGSMGTNDPTNERLKSAISLVNKLDPLRDTAGVVSWDYYLKFQYGLTNDFKTLNDTIASITPSDSTNLNVGLQYAVQMLDDSGQSDSVKVIIFLTDGVGQYTYSTNPSSYTAQAANKGYKIFSIGLGSIFDEDPLTDMASATGGQYYFSPDANELQSIFDSILTTIVLHTSPSQVNIIEKTENYIVDETDFTITPDSIIEDSGYTIITWLNVAQYVGNMDDRLAADETFVVSFTIKSVQSGAHLPVAVDGQAVVNYLDVDGNPQSALIPQGYISVYQPILINIEPESVNLKSKGELTVFVYSKNGFDATSIDLSTVSFEGAQPIRWNINGQETLMLKFLRQDLTWTAGTSFGTLTAYTTDGLPVVGSDDVRVF